MQVKNMTSYMLPTYREMFPLSRFHAYAVIMEMDGYEEGVKEGEASQANVILRKKTYGGVPPGAGMREDVIMLFEELEEARNSLNHLSALLRNMPDPKAGQCS